MQIITTTELRTKAKNLVKALEEGKEISLVHRSKVIGQIKPAYIEELKLFDAAKVAEIVKKLNLPRLSYKEREKRYKEHLIKKYGKGLS